MNDLNSLNGSKLPAPLPDHQRLAIEQGMSAYQHIIHERDQLRQENDELRATVATHKLVAEAQAGQVNELESRMHRALIERDEAVARWAELNVLFRSFEALWGTFKPKGSPARMASPPDSPP